MASTRLRTRKVTAVHPGFISALALSLSCNEGFAFSDANWTVLGSGMNERVHALAILGSNVYAGGRFMSAGGKPGAISRRREAFQPIASLSEMVAVGLH